MNTPKFFVVVVVALLWAASAHAKESASTAKDDASQIAYSGGWVDSDGGTGFEGWKFLESHGASDSFAGHLIADTTQNPEIAPIASSGKAFGLYANGSEFETASAFRSFSTPLQAGDTFSFQMTNPVIDQKGPKDDPASGSIGLTLRSGDASDTPDDYNKDARFEIINLKGTSNYQVYDGEANHDTGVVYSDKGISVSITLTGADTYNLAITRLADNQTTKLSSRKLSGSGAIKSFCIFDRNGEKGDGFFNNFQVNGKGK